MQLEPKPRDHTRSFSFSSWQHKDPSSKPQSKYYYNYNNGNNYRSKYEDGNGRAQYRNQYRGDMPTFGEESYRGAKRDRRVSTQESFHSDYKDSREFANKNNYSFDNRQRKQPYQPQPHEPYPTAETRKQARQEFDRATQQKLTNIDKINQKIKKILNTLNEEEKKISQHHIKIGNKKICDNFYAGRIRTQGDQNYFQRRGREKEREQEREREREKENGNIYSKLVGLRDRYRNQEDSYRLEPLRQLYGRENLLKTQKLEPELNYNYNSQSSWKKPEAQALTQNSKWKADSRQKQNKKNNIQKSYQLLKGTNAKSTDSLNLSMSICLKNQRDGQGYQFGNRERSREADRSRERDRDRERERGQKYASLKTQNKEPQRETTSTSTLHHKYTTFQISEQDSSSSYNTESQTKTVSKLTAAQEEIKNESRLEDFRRIEKSCHRWAQGEKEELPSFHEQRDRDREGRTPVRTRFDKSLSRYERSEKSCKLSNGKDLDEEIEKIQKKIDTFESIKKSLNLEQSQAAKKSKADLNRSLSKYKQRSSAQKSTYNPNPYNESAQKPHTKPHQKPSAVVAQFNSNYTLSEQTPQPHPPTPTPKPSSSSQPNDVQICLPKPFKMSSKKTTKRTINHSQVKQIQSAFMSEERSGEKQDSFKLLIGCLCKQIELDASFRNAKKWFQRRASIGKWKELGKELAMRKINTTQAQNRQIFTMTEQQDNPFYTERDDQCSYPILISSFLASQQNWISSLQHKFPSSQIAPYLKQMDIDRKGHITIQDMVRFINLESDKYYRNRDMALVYRRLSGERGEVVLEYLLREFCCGQ